MNHRRSVDNCNRCQNQDLDIILGGTRRTSDYQKKISSYFIVYLSALLLLIPSWPGTIGSLMAKTHAYSLLALCALALIIVLDLKQLKLFLPSRNIILFFLFNLFIISFFRPDTIQSIRTCVAISLNIIIILCFTTLLHSIKFEKALLLFATCLTIVVSLSAIIHISTIGRITFFNHNSLTRVGGIFFFANNAMMVSISILFNIIAFILSKNRQKITKLVVVNITICSIILASTDTRSAMLALLISLSFILVFSKVQLGAKILLILLAIFIALGGYVLLLKSPENKVENDEKLMIREMIWNVALQAIKEKPFIGFGNKKNPFQKLRSGQRINTKLNDAHNAHLMHIIIYGISSYILFITLLLSITKVGVSLLKRDHQILHSIMIFWLIMSFFWGRIFTLTGFTPTIFMISLFGIICHPEAYKNLEKQKRYYIYSVSK